MTVMMMMIIMVVVDAGGFYDYYDDNDDDVLKSITEMIDSNDVITSSCITYAFEL